MINSGLFTSNDSTWTTPPEFFAELDKEFHFTLDAAALASSAVVPNYFGPDHSDPERRDAHSTNWVTESKGGWIFLNPPYGRQIKTFMAKAYWEVKSGAKVVALVPARTDTNWWHSYCIEFEVRFIKGRLKFGGSKQSAPFPSALVIMN